jgi:hypothetical protein
MGKQMARPLGVTHVCVSATARAFAARTTRTLKLAPDRFQMKDFSNASFPPETIAIMKVALDRAVASLPDPVSSAHVQAIAETILRTAKDGERDPAILQRMAMMELQILTRC